MTFLKRAQKFPNIWTTFVKKLLFTPLKIAQSGVINTSHEVGGCLCVALFGLGLGSSTGAKCHLQFDIQCRMQNPSFFKWPYLGLFLFIFCLFQTKNTNFTAN